MIKKLIGVLTGVLALNFLCVAGGVGYLVATKKLDKDKVHTIRDIVMGNPTTAPTSQPATQPTTQEAADDAPMLRLDQLLEKVSHHPAAEQLEIVRSELDAQAALVERRQREVEDQRTQIASAQADLKRDRDALVQQQQQFNAAVDLQTKQATDDGFQKTLALYQAMPAKKAKALFATMDDDVVVRYLQAMDARQASGILKEFKTPQENSRAEQLLEKMRLAQAKAN